MRRMFTGCIVVAVLTTFCAFTGAAGYGSEPPTSQPRPAEDAARAESKKLLAQAQSLYAEGPKRAQKVIELLHRAVEKDPENYDATGLLAVTYFGTAQFEKAVEWFDRAIVLSRARGSLYPRLYLKKAEALFHAGHLSKCRTVLLSMGALFDQDSRAEFRSQYEELQEKVAGAWRDQCLPVVQAACERAIKLHLDPARYLFIVIDKDCHSFILSDSAVAPFVAPLAVQKDWWIVVLAPKSADGDVELGVFVDKQALAVRGHLLSDAPPATGSDHGMPKGWSLGDVITDQGEIPVLYFKPVYGVKAGEATKSS